MISANRGAAFGATVVINGGSPFVDAHEAISVDIDGVGENEIGPPMLVQIVNSDGDVIAKTVPNRNESSWHADFSAVPPGFYHVIVGFAEPESEMQKTVAVVAEIASEPSDRVGIVGHFKSVPIEELGREMDVVRMLGCGWVREGFTWAKIEGKKGNTDWRHFDAITDEARARDINVLAVLGFSTDWSSTAPGDVTGLDRETWPPERRTWTEFVGQIVKRFGGRVSAWEVWNEPNSSTFWKPKPSAAEFGPFFMKTLRAILEVDASARVLCGGLAPGDSESATVPATFLREAFSNQSLFPGTVGLHPYVAARSGSLNSDLERKYLRLLELGWPPDGRQPPRWITEVGVPTSEVGDWHAAEVMTIMIVAALARDGIEKVMVYALRDRQTGANAKENSFGLRYADGSPKPGLLAVHVCLRILQDARFARRYVENGVTWYEWESGSERILVGWRDAGVSTVPPLPGARLLRVVDLEGRESLVTEEDGTPSIQVSQRPTFLIYESQ